MPKIKMEDLVPTVKREMLRIWPNEIAMGKAVRYYHNLETYENENQFMRQCIWQIARFMWRRDEWKFYDEMVTAFSPSDSAIFSLYKKAFMEAYHADPLYVMAIYEWEDTCNTMKEEMVFTIAREKDITYAEARDIIRETQHVINDAKEKIEDVEKCYDTCYDIMYEYTGINKPEYLKYFL